MYFNSLSYFLNCEENSRRDETENVNIYRPSGGLVINNLATGETFTVQAQLNSQVDGADRIFIFCVSAEYSTHLQSKFCAYGCVEISDVDTFKDRLQSKIKDHLGMSELKREAFLSGLVDYYNITAAPGARHACPDQIVMAKPERFAEEKEYRFAFTDDVTLFDVNNVRYDVSSGAHQASPISGHALLKLGSLADICKIIAP